MNQQSTNRGNSIQKLALKNLSLNSNELTTVTDSHIFGWQAGKSTIKDRMSHMCLNEQLADVVFIFDNSTENNQIRVNWVFETVKEYFKIIVFRKFRRINLFYRLVRPYLMLCSINTAIKKIKYK